MSLRLGFTRGQTHNLNIVQSIFMLRVVLFFNMSRQLSLHIIKAYLTEADTRPHVLHNQSHMYTDHSVCYMYCVLYHCKLMFSQYKHNLCQAPHKLHNKNNNDRVFIFTPHFLLPYLSKKFHRKFCWRQQMNYYLSI